MHFLSSSRALATLHAGCPLMNVQVEHLNLVALHATEWRQPITVTSCQIGALDASFLALHALLTADRCQVGGASFMSTVLFA